MPVDRETAADLVGQTVALYAEAESRIIADLRRRFSDDDPAPDWAVRQLSAIGQVRRHAALVVATLERDVEGVVANMLAEAYSRGGTAAARELAKIAGASDRDVDAIEAELPGIGDVQTLVMALMQTLRATGLHIVRWAVDVFREVIAAVVPHALAGLATRRVVAQRAFDRLLARGVTSFIDRAGRRWQLASYVEMATRTTVAQAAVQGHIDQMVADGYDLVIVSDSPQECALCRPWEGRVLSIGGAPGLRKVRREHALTGKMVTVQVAGNVAAALAAGLFHPNCTHALSAYLVGVTTIPTGTANPEGDKARQRLRELERRKRDLLRREAGALTPEHRRKMTARVREVNRLIAAHVADTGLIRQRPRERIGTAR